MWKRRRAFGSGEVVGVRRHGNVIDFCYTPSMKNSYKYRAFISYSHKDKVFAKWLQKKIENYVLPKHLHRAYPNLPQDLTRSIFRDDEELAGAWELSSALQKALKESEKLIVLCSPDAVNSLWVEKEIESFLKDHDEKDVITVVINGEAEDVIPPLLRHHREPLAIDIKSGKKRMLFKVIASLLDIGFSDLWKREKKAYHKRLLIRSAVFGLMLIVGVYAYMQSRAISSNVELEEVRTSITKIEHILAYEKLSEEEVYKLSAHLKELEQLKKDKEETLKWFGMLKTSIAQKAKYVYDKEGVEKALEVLESDLSKSEDEVYAKKNILRAKLYIEKSDFQHAKEAYEKAVAIDASYLNLYDYALFLSRQNALQKAKEKYQQLLSYDLSDAHMANVLNRLGILYRKLKAYDEAEKVYKKALVLRANLAEKNPKSYTEDLAWTYNNMGVLYQESNQTDKSEKALQKAYVLRQQLARENPKKYAHHLSCSRHNLGELYSSMHEYEKAEVLLLSSLEERRKLVKENPKEYTPALASTLYELAGVHYSMRDYTEAERMYNEVLVLRQELFKRNPSAYKSVFIETLQALVKVYEITRKKQKEQKIQNVLKEVQNAA